MHPLLLNTITPKVGIFHEAEGRGNIRHRVCNSIVEGAIFVLLYTYTESVEKKNYDEEGRKTKGEKSVTQTWLDLNSVPLGWGVVRRASEPLS